MKVEENSASFLNLNNVLMCSDCGSSEVTELIYFLKQWMLTYVYLFLNLLSVTVIAGLKYLHKYLRDG